MVEVYQVKSGDSPWVFAKVMLQNEGKPASNSDIAKKVAELPSIYGCASMEEFSRKYFSKVGTNIEIKFGNRNSVANNGTSASNPIQTNRKDSTFNKSTHLPCDAIPDSSRRVFGDTIFKPNNINRNDSDSIFANLRKTALARKLQETPTQTWDSVKAEQERINNLPTDKDRIIEYNRTIGGIKENYVIVDKKNYTATVYSPDGNVVKSYEIGVAKNKSDALLKRSYKTKEGQIEATSAGIYTANYRATGRDAYSRLYNDRVLTLSNDGLREKGVGNGETGVAFHQVPNGNTARTNKLKAPGVSEENNRFSSGCVNFLPEDFDDCMKNITGVGTKVYILPEDENNFMTVKNGQLHFAQKEYTGDVATTSTKNNPVKNIRIRSKNNDMNQEGQAMASTLSSQKVSLAKDLGIDNDTYNNLAMLTLGIAGQETQWGDSEKYWLKENCQWGVNLWKSVKGNNSYNSKGLTQMKIDSYTDPEVKRLFQKYDITSENVNQGNKAAIATMIVLSCMYKNELPALKENMENLNVSAEDALLYCWNNQKYKIKNGTAKPDNNDYHQNVHRFMNEFDMYQSVA